MLKPSRNKLVNRIIDANLNRLKEGLRVCEEIARFILNSPSLTKEFKALRHRAEGLSKRSESKIILLRERQALKDVGKNIYLDELKRKGYQDIFFANIQRVKEAVRVLEEFSKLKSITKAKAFKRMRYNIYEIEKKTAKRISSLPDFG